MIQNVYPYFSGMPFYTSEAIFITYITDVLYVFIEDIRH